MRNESAAYVTYADGRAGSVPEATVRADRLGARVELHVGIPFGVTALVHAPADGPASITEGGVPAAEAKGLELVRAENGVVVFRAGSGSYSFQVRGATAQAEPPRVERAERIDRVRLADVLEVCR